MADRRDLRGALGLLAAAVVGVAVLAFGAGLLFGRATPERAASALLDEFVDDTSPPAPGSAAPRCGLLEEPVGRPTRDAVRAAGGVTIGYLPEVVDLAALRRLADAFPATLLVAPDPTLDRRVVARSRTRIMVLDRVDPRLLGAFATAYGQPVCDDGTATPGS